MAAAPVTEAGRLDLDVAARIKKECGHRDIEVAHWDADRIVIEMLEQLGFVETVAAWKAVEKCYA